MSRAESYARVKALRDTGLLHREITEITGLSRSYVSTLLTDPDASKEAERKEGYRKPCPDCGTLMSGSDGMGESAPKHCVQCRGRRSKIWTREAILEAIQVWAEIHGKPPRATDWNTTLAGQTHEGYPSTNSVFGPNAPFEYWADAIEAAGFPRPLRGRYTRTPEMYADRIQQHVSHARVLELARQGMAYGQIAEVVGCAKATAQKIGHRSGIRRGTGWKTGQPHTEEEPMTGSITRPYLVFRENGDGALVLIGETEQSNTVDAVEALAEMPGRYAAVATGSLQRMDLQPRLVASKLPQNDEGPT